MALDQLWAESAHLVSPMAAILSATGASYAGFCMDLIHFPSVQHKLEFHHSDVQELHTVGPPIYRLSLKRQYLN